MAHPPLVAKRGPRPRTIAAGACPDALRPPRSEQRGAPLFEPLLSFCVALRVPGARLLAREPHFGAAPASCSKGDNLCRNERPSSGTDRPGSRRNSRHGRARHPAGSLTLVPLPPLGNVTETRSEPVADGRLRHGSGFLSPTSLPAVDHPTRDLA